MTQTQGPPAGWYPHPSMAGTQCYWDGSEWTDHVAPATPAAPVSPIRPAAGFDDRLLGIGYIAALMLPIVGFVIGAVVIAKGKTGHGTAMMVIAVAVGLSVFGVYVA